MYKIHLTENMKVEKGHLSVNELTVKILLVTIYVIIW